LKPDSFDVSRLFKIGGLLGVLSTIEGVALTVVGLPYFNLNGNIDRIYTFGFAYLVLAGLFNLMVVRERNHFWKSRPSNALIITVISEILIGIVISSIGFLELAPLGYAPLIGVFTYTLVVSLLINDSVKVYLMGKFKANHL